jgi:hypothetical protein
VLVHPDTVAGEANPTSEFSSNTRCTDSAALAWWRRGRSASDGHAVSLEVTRPCLADKGGPRAVENFRSDWSREHKRARDGAAAAESLLARCETPGIDSECASVWATRGDQGQAKKLWRRVIRCRVRTVLSLPGRDEESCPGFLPIKEFSSTSSEIELHVNEEHAVKVCFATFHYERGPNFRHLQNHSI